MDKKELQEILRLHKRWLDGSPDGKRADLHGADLHCADLHCADLRYADLHGADLRYADLRYANLHGADLRYADLDYSCWPLWCGSLNVKIDDGIARQLLYHLVRAMMSSPGLSSELKKAIYTDTIEEQANLFHRVDECGRICFADLEEGNG